MLKKLVENNKKYKVLKADWSEEKERAARESWEMLVEKTLEARRGTNQQTSQLIAEEEKGQYFRNCYNYILLT